MANQPQTLKNHARFDPAFHFFLAPLAVLFVVYAIVGIVRSPDWDNIVRLLAALFAFVALGKMRMYANKVQDRVIRLEERLRMEELVPPPLQARIPELTEDQVIGLRFASDAELPDLVAKTLEGNWKRKQIKEAVRNWRPDYFRV
ncbi:MAG TPA: DUF6526 family protein [Bryobacteraceae bacterium]